MSRNIQAARAAKGWTQRDLAVRVEVDQMLVSKWERGWHRPSEGNLHLLAHELGVSIAWLYTDQPEREIVRHVCGDDCSTPADLSATEAA